MKEMYKRRSGIEGQCLCLNSKPHINITTQTGLNMNPNFPFYSYLNFYIFHTITHCLLNWFSSNSIVRKMNFLCMKCRKVPFCARNWWKRGRKNLVQLLDTLTDLVDDLSISVLLLLQKKYSIFFKWCIDFKFFYKMSIPMFCRADKKGS